MKRFHQNSKQPKYPANSSSNDHRLIWGFTPLLSRLFTSLLFKLIALIIFLVSTYYLSLSFTTNSEQKQSSKLLVIATSFLEKGWKPVGYSEQLPSWFEDNRVQGHTRLSVQKWLGTPEFKNAASGFKQLGARVFVRHVKSAAEDPWWYGTVSQTPDNQIQLETNSNPVKIMIDEAHQEGMKIIAYYFHSTDKTMATLHPEWVCKQPNGRVISHRRRGDYLDLTSPYREIVLERLLELAAMGVDGFYFDEIHMPYKGCWGTFLETAFEQATGEKAPMVKNERDPHYRRYLQFQALKVEETLAYWREAVRKQYPKVIFTISTTTIPSLINPRMTTNLVRLSDSPKSEFFLAIKERLNLNVFQDKLLLAKPEKDIRMALGWTVLRDGAEGRPPHIWAPGFPNREHALGFVSAVLTYGAIANLDVAEENLLGDGKKPRGTPRVGLKAAFALGKQVSPYLSQTRPVRWAAIHYSELSRDRRGSNLVAAWREVLWPVTGSFGVFVREGLPVGIVNDYQLARGQLEGYRLLFLPNPNELTPAQRRIVEQFQAKGGVVLRNDPGWPWSIPGRTPEAIKAFRRLLAEHLDTAPVLVTGGPEKMHSVAFRHPGKDRLVVAISNDFTWVQLKQNLRQSKQTINSPPPAIKGITVEINSSSYPQKIFEVLSGQSLKFEHNYKGYKIIVPEFSKMAVIVVE